MSGSDRFVTLVSTLDVARQVPGGADTNAHCADRPGDIGSERLISTPRPRFSTFCAMARAAAKRFFSGRR